MATSQTCWRWVWAIRPWCHGHYTQPVLPSVECLLSKHPLTRAANMGSCSRMQWQLTCTCLLLLPMASAGERGLDQCSGARHREALTQVGAATGATCSMCTAAAKARASSRGRGRAWLHAAKTKGTAFGVDCTLRCAKRFGGQNSVICTASDPEYVPQVDTHHVCTAASQASSTVCMRGIMHVQALGSCLTHTTLLLQQPFGQ
jgi:hypothetical protein